MNSPLGEIPAVSIQGEVLRNPHWPCRVVAVTGWEHITADSERDLFHHGIVISRYQDPGAALVSIGAAPPPLVLVDTDIQGISLPDFVRVLVQEAGVPALVGVRSNEESRDLSFRALEYGARGLISLPTTAERLARAITQLNLSSTTVADILTSGPVVLHTHSRRVHVDGQAVHLTKTEFDTLAYLMAEAPRVVPLEELAMHLSGGRPLHRDAIRIALGRARRKLEVSGEAPVVENVRGVGYRMSAALDS